MGNGRAADFSSYTLALVAVVTTNRLSRHAEDGVDQSHRAAPAPEMLVSSLTALKTSLLRIRRSGGSAPRRIPWYAGRGCSVTAAPFHRGNIFTRD
jgi:hypothetical protein